MATFLVAIAPVVAGACFPSLGDLTSGGGTEGGEPGGEGGGGGDADRDAKAMRKDGAVSDAKDRDRVSSADTSSADGSPEDSTEEAVCAADTSDDPANCGSCNHDCLGGTCMGGQCQPITLATTSGSVGIAIDSTYIYWANAATSNSGIYKISKALTGAGTPSTVEVGASYTKVQGLASDGTYVYWTNKTATGSVQRALPTGTAGSLTTLATGQDQPDWIAVTVDGADEVDPNLDLIKGYGRALVR
jgi:hypothetical protein